MAGESHAEGPGAEHVEHGSHGEEHDSSGPGDEHPETGTEGDEYSHLGVEELDKHLAKLMAHKKRLEMK
jgi:hypothetical protein